jgi:hypothetical protein
MVLQNTQLSPTDYIKHILSSSHGSCCDEQVCILVSHLQEHEASDKNSSEVDESLPVDPGLGPGLRPSLPSPGLLWTSLADYL